MQFLFLLNCVIAKTSGSVIFHFCCQCFLTCILFEKFFFLIHEDLNFLSNQLLDCVFGLGLFREKHASKP